MCDNRDQSDNLKLLDLAFLSIEQKVGYRDQSDNFNLPVQCFHLTIWPMIRRYIILLSTKTNKKVQHQLNLFLASIYNSNEKTISNRLCEHYDWQVNFI